jgi:hypothetical protein
MPRQAVYLLPLCTKLIGDSVLDSSLGKPASGVNIHLQEFIPGNTDDDLGVFQTIDKEYAATLWFLRKCCLLLCAVRQTLMAAV